MSKLYYNGTILTMDEKCLGRRPSWCGTAESPPAADMRQPLPPKTPGCTRIDLGAGPILTGFLDGHSHIAGLSASLSQYDLARVTEFQGLVRAMRAFIAENAIPNAEWAVGTNYDHNFLTQRCHPDRSMLDAVFGTQLGIPAQS